MTAETLAAAAGVSKVTLSDFEIGKRSPHPRTLDAIRSALEAAGVEFTNDDQPGVRLTIEKADNDLIANYLPKGPCLIRGDFGGIAANSLKDALVKARDLASSGGNVSSIEVLGQVRVGPNQIRRLIDRILPRTAEPTANHHFGGLGTSKVTWSSGSGPMGGPPNLAV